MIDFWCEAPTAAYLKCSPLFVVHLTFLVLKGRLDVAMGVSQMALTL